ncbi:uncharacterized protein PG986_011463 [Apiospora aurea]|uniref:Zn(2)-C6 fungal-type domain-containing protein n=1 Tax=Apiospora aurea TaxID=335848 RepID=A0ABR1Q573_9PEZI
MEPRCPKGSGKFTQLRASCDACSELKVRRGRAQPDCARCVRRGTPCVYGRSRRSHRDAPKVGDSKSTTTTTNAKRHDRNPDCIKSPISPGRMTPTTVKVQKSGSPSLPVSPALFETNIPMPCVDSLATMEQMSYTEGNRCLLSPLDPPSDFDAHLSTNPAPSIFPPHNEYDIVTPPSSAQSPDNNALTPEIAHGPVGAGRCGCMASMAQHILFVSCGLPAEQPMFNDQLSRVRQAIIAAENGISCNCASIDDSILRISTPAVSILVHDADSIR